MDKIWYYILIIGGPIGILGVYLAFGEYIIKFLRWILKKEDYKKKIGVKILEWFAIIDGNLTENSIELQGLEHIENEIDFLFNTKKNSKLVLKFSNCFINKYLKFCGIQKKYRTKENFIKFAHLKHDNLEVILGLELNLHKTKFSQFKMPFKTYWNLLRGNFNVFHQQYLNEWNGVMEDQKVVYSDIEMPIKLLRLYLKLY